MHDVVGDQLPGVVGCREVAERQVHDRGRRTRLGQRRHCRLAGGRRRLTRGAAEQVTVQRVADVGDRAARHQRHDPAVLTDDVVDQGPHVPVGARRRCRPAVDGHGSHRGQEGIDRAAVEVHDLGLTGHPCPPWSSPCRTDRAPRAGEPSRGRSGSPDTVGTREPHPTPRPRLRVAGSAGSCGRPASTPRWSSAVSTRTTSPGRPPTSRSRCRCARRRRWPPRCADALVLGCDSVLDLDGEALGKPADAAEAVRRWQQMRGRSGVLRTGHCLVDTRTGRDTAEVAATMVHFADLDDAEIEAYVGTGEPLARRGGLHHRRPRRPLRRGGRGRPAQRGRPVAAAAAPDAARPR